MKEDVVWETILANHYVVTLVRTAPYQGKLTISDAGQEVFSQAVGLMYDARPFPCIADIVAWLQTAVNFVHNQKS